MTLLLVLFATLLVPGVPIALATIAASSTEGAHQ